MSNGIRILLDNGRVIDSSVKGASFVDSITVGVGGAGSRGYAHLAGFNIYAVPIAVSASSFGGVYTSVDYSAGYPVLTWGRYGVPSGVPTTAIAILVLTR